jgi:flagella basal body P-ring formation protein FlgA
MKSQQNSFIYHKSLNRFFLNLEIKDVTKLFLVALIKLSIITIICVFLSNFSFSQSTLNQSTFNGERLKEAVIEYINSSNSYQKEIQILQTIPDFQFKEENVTAIINDEGSFFKGNSNLKLEFFGAENNRLLKSYNVVFKVKTFAETFVTTKTLRIGEIISRDAIRIAKIETTDLEDRDLFIIANGINQDLNFSSILDKKVNSNIIKSSAVLKSMIDSESTIKRGEKVTVLAQNGIVTIRAKGTALNDAKIGENIKVQRDGAAIVMNGIVSDDKLVIIK